MTTSSLQARRGPTVVELGKGSFAVCHQVTTLDRAKLTKRVGALPAAMLRQVEEGLKAALDLD